MSKRIEKDGIEIVTSRYWPTNILRSVSIDLNAGSFHDKITFSADQTKAVYEALSEILDQPMTIKPTGGEK